MNNKDNNQNRSLLDQQRGTSTNLYQNYLTQQGQRNNQAYSDDKNLRDDIYNQYSSSNNFMPQGMSPNSQGWFNIPESMGGATAHASADYGAAKSGYQNMADTGGQDTFQPALDSYKNFMNTGGLGGQEDNMRYRATSMVPAFYQKYKDSLSRRSNVQGGYSPGYDAQMQEIGREAGRQGYDASRKAEADIADKQMQGRMFGTSGYANAAGAITGNKLSGLGGLKGIGDSELGASEFNAGSDNAATGRNQEMQKFLMGLYSQGAQAKTGGLQNLYSSAPGATGQANAQYLQGLTGMSADQLQNLALRSGIRNKSWTDLIAPTMGMAGSIFAGAGA